MSITAAVIVSRMGSSRLPGKATKMVLGRPLLQYIVERVRKCKYVNKIVIATPDKPENKPIVDLARSLGVYCYQGSDDDVLDRTVKAARSVNADVIALVNGDRSLIDPAIIDMVVKMYNDKKPDYCCNNLKRTYPLGMAAEAVSTDLLGFIADTNHDKYVREHITLDFYENSDKYRIINIEAPEELRMPSLRLCLDTEEDLEFITKIYEELYPTNPDFGIKDIIQLLKANPDLAHINVNVKQKGARE